MSEKVTYKTLNNANVRVDNSVDAERTYDISANANIGNTPGMAGASSQGNVSSIDGGEVKRKTDGMTVATFSSHGSGNLSINHMNTASDEQCQVTAAVNEFIKDVKEKASAISPLSL